MDPKTPNSQPQGAIQQGPEFQELVVQQEHAETREQILRLREDISIDQYREYLAKPENVSLVNRINSVNFQLGSLNFAEKNQLKELFQRF